MKDYSLNTRISFMLVTLFCTALFASLYIAVGAIHRNDLRFAEQTARQQARILQERILNNFLRESLVLEANVKKGVFQDWLKSPKSPDETANMLSLMAENCKATDCYGWSMHADIDGTGYRYNKDLGSVNPDDLHAGDSVWYDPLVSSHETLVVKSGVSDVGDIRIFLNYIVRDAGRPLGVIAVFSKQVSVIERVLGGDVFGAINLIVDDQGNVNSKSPSIANYQGKKVDALFGGTLRAAMFERRAKSENTPLLVREIRIDGQHYLAASTYIPRVNWFSVSLYPINNSYSYFASQDSLMVFVGVFLLLVMSVFWLLRHYVITPLQLLLLKVKRIESGDYSAAYTEVGDGEMRDLGQHIDRMANTIERQISEVALERDRAEETSRVKSDFLANMSHEIRTPMNGIIMSLDLSLAEPLPDSAKHLISVAKGSANSLLHIINDVLDLSKIDNGKMAIHPQPFSLAHLVSFTRDLMEPVAEEKGLSFRVDIKGGDDLWLQGDEVRIQQIINNLTNNAIKFTDEGSVYVSVSYHNGEGSRGVLRVDVKDTGTGIKPDDQANLFQRFSQLKRELSQAGTGLGLAICSELVRLMDGKIRVESDGANGSLFWFSVPLSSTEAPKEELAQSGDPMLASLNILVAEDQPINRMLIEKLLKKRGHKVTFAENGEEAVAAILADDADFDIVLMDNQMPLMTGVEATVKIRASGHKNSNIPVIALTADALDEQRAQFAEAGMNGFSSKPIQENALFDEVARVLL